MRSDRIISISTGASRTSKQWKLKELLWSEFVESLRIPIESAETIEEFKAMSKEDKDSLKDVGGFVGGKLSGTQRLARYVLYRDLITLDADNIKSGGTQAVIEAVRDLQIPAVIYSTRNHIPTSPRLRIIIPLAGPCTLEEHEPVARKIASWIDPTMEIFDKTTFDVSRLMYYPSICKRAEYVFEVIDPDYDDVFCDKDNVLADYDDWSNALSWPTHPDTELRRRDYASARKDPKTIGGSIGAFCTLYDVHGAIQHFIPDKYYICDGFDGQRYTYAESTTTAGAIVYDDGNFLYSNHATDPASGQLCNAFDLVRIHKFGSLDEGCDVRMKTSNLPSYKEMLDFCNSIPEVRTLEVRQAFAKVEVEEAVNLDFLDDLEIEEKTNKVKATVDNFLRIIENDPNLKDRIVYNEMDGRKWVVSPMNWDEQKYFRDRPWCDMDDAALRHYTELTYGIYSKDRIKDALSAYFIMHKTHPVREYLDSLEWDGVPRLDSILMDYFGVEENVYTKAIGRKTFAGAVARIYEPGCKFDYMLLIVGKQGIGKSTFFHTMGGDWFSDSLYKFKGKDAAEQIQGKWIIESGELSGLSKSSMNDVKAFISARADDYRGSYQEHTDHRPRQCILVGTTNESHFLSDITGARRFWTVDTRSELATLSIFKDLPENRDQLWAEAKYRYEQGEPLYLEGEAKELAEFSQEAHSEINPKEGAIREFVERKLPKPDIWNKLSTHERKMFWDGEFKKSYPDDTLVRRDFITSAEIQTECLRRPLSDLKKAESREINAILERIPGWIRSPKRKWRGQELGRQRGFERINGAERSEDREILSKDDEAVRR